MMEQNSLLLLGITALPLLGVLVLLSWKNATKTQAALVGIVSECFALVIPLFFLPVLKNGQSVQFSVSWIANLGISFSLELNWLSMIFLMTEVLVTLAAMAYSLGEKTGEKSSNHYYALLLLFSLGMSGTTLAEDIFLFYVFWELMLVASVLLILIWGHGENRFRIALKYFIITHLGSLMVLVCLITLYVNTGFASLSALTTQAHSLPANMQVFLTLFFVIGFCVKMAIFPLHLWLPDAHTIAPMPVTIILAAAMLSMGAYGILRFPFTLFPLETLQPFAIWLMAAGLVSEVYGALMALAEKDIKRIIAYSSVSQMGYILFGFGSLTEQGMVGGVMHVVYHAIIKALLFMVVGIVIAVTGEREIEKMSGLGKMLPITCVCGAIAALGISGMPPLGIFNSEWLIFAGGFESGYPIALTVATLVGSLFTVIYALRFFGTLFFGPTLPENGLKKTPQALLIPTVAVTAFLIVEGLLPAPLLDWAQRSIQSLFGGGF